MKRQGDEATKGNGGSMLQPITILLSTLLAVDAAAAGGQALQVRVAKPHVNDVDIPLHCRIELPHALAGAPANEISAHLTLDDADRSVEVAGQLVRDASGGVEVWWILPHGVAGSAANWSIRLTRTDESTPGAFRWRGNTPGRLERGGLPVVEYVHAFDDSTPKRLEETYKPFYHVFDSRGRQLTKGPGGLYTHHRGLFIGWNRLTCDGRELDFWHMIGVTQRHRAMLEYVAGQVLARITARIDWVDGEDRTLISERRRLTVIDTTDPTARILLFDTRLTAGEHDLELRGDPEHGGFQFRAHNGIAEGPPEVKATYFFHEDGVDPRTAVDLSWAAMSFGQGDSRATVLHVNLPGNPSPTVYSAYRDYGRVGAFFERTIAAGASLDLRYGLVVFTGRIPARDELAAWAAALAHPPTVEACGSLGSD
jgi:hypothetical protein